MWAGSLIGEPRPTGHEAHPKRKKKSLCYIPEIYFMSSILQLKKKKIIKNEIKKPPRKV